MGQDKERKEKRQALLQKILSVTQLKGLQFTEC